MPKKRKRPRKQDRSRNQLPDPQRSRESTLGAFARWLRERRPDVDTAVYEDVARTAVEMKADRLSEPSPAIWDNVLIEIVVGQLLPGKVLGDDEYARTVVPGMRAYLEFLRQSGRFRGDEGAHRGALRTLDELEPSMVERFRDTDNKSMAGRIMSLAMAEGVDVTDEAQLEEFIERYNAMPQEWREHITGGPDPASAAANSDFVLDVPETTPAPSRPRFDVVIPDETDEAAALRGIPFLRQVTALLDWVGSSRPVTGTGALRRKDIPEVVERLGVELPTVAVRSMWELTDLADVWFAAIECGILERTATTVRPGPYSAAWQRGEPADTLRLGRALVGQLILQVIEGIGDVPSSPLVPQLADLTTMLLSTAAAGVQHNFREIAEEFGAGGPSPDIVRGLILDVVMARMERLAMHGVVSLIHSTLRIARPLGPSFIAPLRLYNVDLHPVDADGREAPWEPPPLRGVAAAEAKAAAEVAMTYQIKVALADTKPPIWRRLRLSGGTSLADLHDIIQTAFGWENAHMYRFAVGHPYGNSVCFEPTSQREFSLDIGGPAPRDAAKATLAQLAQRPRDKFTYLYDFGDDWIHTITVESIDTPDPAETLPRCTGGKRMAPYEDSGGVWGWEMKVAAALDDSDGEHEEIREWLGLEPGDSFDPDEFDPHAVTRALHS